MLLTGLRERLSATRTSRNRSPPALTDPATRSSPPGVATLGCSSLTATLGSGRWGAAGARPARRPPARRRPRRPRSGWPSARRAGPPWAGGGSRVFARARVRGGGSRGVGEHPRCGSGAPPLPGVGEAGAELVERHPGHLVDLDVLVAQLPARGLEQVVVHGLVDAPVLGDEPVVDGAQRRHDPAPDAGLLLDLAHGGVLGGLPGLDVALGQRPRQAPPTVPAADQGHLRTLAAAVDDQAAGRGLLHLAPPGARTRPPATAAARAAVVAVPWGGRWGHLAMVARPRYVGRGPCRGLARR